MKRRVARLAGLAAVALSAAGCGSITRGTTEMVTITANPPEARIRTSLGIECPRSPCIVTVDRNKPFVAYAEAPGYQPGSVQVDTQLVGAGAAGFAGNVLAGGVIGMGVDAYTGAALDHKPNPAHIELAPIQRAAPPAPPARQRPGVVRREKPIS